MFWAFEYSEMNEVMKLVKDFDIKITNQGYDSKSTLNANILVSKTESLLAKVDLLNKTGHDIELKVNP